MTSKSSIRKGTKWLITGSVSSQLLQFVFSIALARLLTPSDFGLLVTVQIFTGFVGMVASGGMGEALVRAKEVDEKSFNFVFSFQLAIGLVIYTVFYFTAPYFAQWFGNPLYEPLLRVSALTFLLRPFSNRPNTQLRREMRFKEIAISQFVTLIIASSLSVALALNQFGVWSLVIGGLTGAFFNILLLSWHAPWKPAFLIRHVDSNKLGAYGVKTTANELLVYLRNQTNNLMITRLLGASPVGIFNKADSLSSMPANMIGGTTYQTVFRAMSGAQDNLDQSRYLYFHSIKLIALYSFPIYLALAWVTQPFIVGVFGVHWRDTALPLLILCLIGPFRCVEYMSGALVAARDLLAEETKLQFQTWILLIVLSMIGLQFGLPGVAWATVLASAHISIRLCRLALRSIHSRASEIFSALAPVLKLCAIQFLGSLALFTLLFWLRADLPDLLYTALMAGNALAIYTLAFLFFTPTKLIPEANRWRERIGLSPVAS